MSYDSLLDDLVQRAGFPSREEASTAVHGVFDALGDALAPDDAAALAEALPQPLGSVLLRGSQSGLGGDSFYDRVGARADVGRDVAQHHARVVLGAIAQDLPVPLRQRLAGALPDVAPEPSTRAPRTRRRNGNGKPRASASAAAIPRPAGEPTDK